MSNRRLVPLNVVALPALPVGGHRPGDLVYNETDGNLYVSDGSSWTNLGGAAGPYGSADFGTDFAAQSTDGLTEGTTNLYFTDARAVAATAGAYDPAGSSLQAEVAANLYTDQSIQAFDGLPDQTGNSGRFLTTDGASASWEVVDTSGAVELIVSYYQSPSNPQIGQIYFDRSTNSVRVYDGSGWGDMGGGSGSLIGGTSSEPFAGITDGGSSGTTYTATAVLDGGASSSY